MAYMLAASTLTVRKKDDREMYRPLLLLQEEDGNVRYMEILTDYLTEEEAGLLAQAHLRSLMLDTIHRMKELGCDEINGVRDRDEPT